MTDRLQIAKETQQALFGLHVDAFIEGLAEAPPSPEEFGLTEDEAKPIRDAFVKDACARTDWNAA